MIRHKTLKQNNRRAERMAISGATSVPCPPGPGAIPAPSVSADPHPDRRPPNFQRLLSDLCVAKQRGHCPTRRRRVDGTPLSTSCSRLA